MRILGISAFYHDSAAALIRDGEIVAAAQEERFSRKKHDDSFPRGAVEYCLKEGGMTASQLDAVAFYDKPAMKFDRILKTHLLTAPFSLESFLKAVPLWITSKLHIRSILENALKAKLPVYFPEHHESHAASAFYASPYKDAAFLTMDGVGEWATTSWGIGRDTRMRILSEIHFPHSLGLLYSAFTYYLGFKINSGEYKLMGLAPYGEPKYVKEILDHLIDLKPDGSYRLNLEYFGYVGGLKTINGRFERLFGLAARKEGEPFEEKYLDIARSIQEVPNEAVLRMVRHVRQETGDRNLCLAGGVALNCVANGKILKEKIFDNIWIQPAAGDAGGAPGAALYVYHHYLGKPRVLDRHPRGIQKASLWGPSFTDEEIGRFLDGYGCVYEKLGEEELLRKTAEAIASEKVVGWFQGRMEFGPRALGARSILGDPRSPKMQSVMNVKIKFRESFRPFAPAVLRERCSEYFDMDADSPYMLLVAGVADKQRLRPNAAPAAKGLRQLSQLRSTLPAVTHVDYSARIQTVDDQNPVFYKLLKAFERLTGCPALINTSFNVRGEPIVCRPEEAFRCFMKTNMDVLVVGPYFIEKERQTKAEPLYEYAAIAGTD